MTANMSAATPVLLGSTRLSIAAVATAASMALPPSRMICRPACAASGWLVGTMPCGAITSARLCAAQPSARSPRTAAQAAALGAASQVDSCGPACGQEGEAPANKAIAAANEYVRILKSIMTSSRLQQTLDLLFCGTNRGVRRKAISIPLALRGQVPGGICLNRPTETYSRLFAA